MNDLAILFVHKNITLDSETVINKLTKKLWKKDNCMIYLLKKCDKWFVLNLNFKLKYENRYIYIKKKIVWEVWGQSLLHDGYKTHFLTPCSSQKKIITSPLYLNITRTI